MSDALARYWLENAVRRYRQARSCSSAEARTAMVRVGRTGRRDAVIPARMRSKAAAHCVRRADHGREAADECHRRFAALRAQIAEGSDLRAAYDRAAEEADKARARVTSEILEPALRDVDRGVESLQESQGSLADSVTRLNAAVGSSDQRHERQTALLGLLEQSVMARGRAVGELQEMLSEFDSWTRGLPS